MNDLERTIIDLGKQIDELYIKKDELQLSLNEIMSRKDGSSSKSDRYFKKFERIKEEFNSLRMKKLNCITIPSIGLSITSLVLLSGAPLSFCAAILGLSCAAGYRLSYDMVYHNMLRRDDERLLERVFPSIKDKKEEYEKAYVEYLNFHNKFMQLSCDENEIREELESVLDGICKLKGRRSSLCNLYFKKLEDSDLPYCTELEDVISKTIANPDKFYTNICNGLNHKERNDIVENIQNKSCSNCTNSSCKLSDEEKESISNCKSWFNEVEIGMSKVLRR